jgi:hypothetical protein
MPDDYHISVGESLVGSRLHRNMVSVETGAHKGLPYVRRKGDVR